MNRKVLLQSVSIFLLGSLAVFADPSQWSLEVNGGYDFPAGQGISWLTYGNSEPTLTYYSEKRNAIGNSGIHGELRVSYIFTDRMGVALALSGLYNQSSLSSGYGYSTSGSVVTNWKQSFSYTSFRLTPSLKYWFLKGPELGFFGLMGPLVLFPSPIHVESTISSLKSSTQWNYYPGIGVHAEVGTQFLVEKNWGFVFALALEKISLARVSVVTTSSTGVVSTTRYDPNPITDNNGQTASDKANSTATQKYYTSASLSDDFSDYSLKLGLVWQF